MRRLCLVIGIVVCCSLLAYGQLGGLKKASKPADSGGGGGDVDALIQQIQAVQLNFSMATDKLVEAQMFAIEIYSNQEKRAELAQKVAQIREIKEPDKKQKEMAAVAVESNKLTAAISEQDIQNKKLSDQQKGDATRTSFNVLLAVLKDKAAVDEAKELLPKAQSAAKDLGSNPQNAAKARNLNSGVSSLQAIAQDGPTQISAANGTTQTLSKIRKANGIPDPPQPDVKGDFH